MDPIESPPSPVVGLSLQAPGRQRRATVGFRVILAVPHFLYANVLGLVVFFATVVAWFAALFTARVPAGLAEFNGRILRYLARVYGYAYYLLSDRYPPFVLEPESPYAVEVELAAPMRLNRAAVLFRLVLLFPVGFVTTVVGYGVWIPLIVIWLIVLVSGRMPRAPFEALAAVLRYQLRVMAFGMLLTSEYPRGLFGDKNVAPSPHPVDATVAVDELPAPPDTATEPRIDRLVLSKGAKALAVLIVTLGALLLGGAVIAGVVNGSRNSRAYDEFVAADGALGSAKRTYDRDVQTCAISGGTPCLHDADSVLANALAQFRRQLGAIRFPTSAIGAAADLDDAAADAESALRKLAGIADPAEYQRALATFQSAGQRISAAEAALYNALGRFNG